MVIKTESNLVNQYEMDGIIYFDYGTIKKGDNTSINLIFNGNNIQSLTLEPTCGCTIVEPRRVDENTFVATVSYNSNILGSFAKMIRMSSQENGQPIKHQNLKIKGNVVQ